MGKLNAIFLKNEHNWIYQKNFMPSLEGQLSQFLPQFYCNLNFIISPEKEHSQSECYEGNLTKFPLACLGQASFN